mmetsp:Transcript_19225/g.29474  ORF Transcript_19225/g.29474 Transcript_19225/m.29474 type:complete len:154 (+) Transcript_19225:468-929(+)
MAPPTLASNMVVQRYLDSPLLLNGYKFDLRVYVIVAGLTPDTMRAYVADEGLARFCTVPYEKPSSSNYRKACMHLTNYSVNKVSSDFVNDMEQVDNFTDINDNSKRTLSSLFKELEQSNDGAEVVQKLKASIKYACSGIMAMFGNMILHKANP